MDGVPSLHRRYHCYVLFIIVWRYIALTDRYVGSIVLVEDMFSILARKSTTIYTIKNSSAKAHHRSPNSPTYIYICICPTYPTSTTSSTHRVVQEKTNPSLVAPASHPVYPKPLSSWQACRMLRDNGNISSIVGSFCSS
jgi:hypothetical protein